MHGAINIKVIIFSTLRNLASLHLPKDIEHEGKFSSLQGLNDE